MGKTQIFKVQIKPTVSIFTQPLKSLTAYLFVQVCMLKNTELHLWSPFVSLNHTLFVSLIYFLGKIKKHGMRQILGMKLDEFLKTAIALLLMLMISDRHFQSIIQSLDPFNTFSITTSVTCLKERRKICQLEFVCCFLELFPETVPHFLTSSSALCSGVMMPSALTTSQLHLLSWISVPIFPVTAGSP